MSAISISKEIIEQVMEEAKGTENEVIGLLIGHYKDGILYIEKAVSGEQESTSTRVKLFSHTTAKIVDKIMNKEIDGLIIGWYHSHPGYGIFMSDTDIQTQSRFHQFSDNVIALVLEPTTNEVGMFSLDEFGRLVQYTEKHILIYGEGEDRKTDELVEASKVPLDSVEYGMGERQKIRQPIQSQIPPVLAPSVLAPLVPWQPLPSKKRLVSEKRLLNYKKILNKSYKSGVLSKVECKRKVYDKEVELGLRPPKI